MSRNSEDTVTGKSSSGARHSGQVACNGVPQPLIHTYNTYRTAIQSGTADQACKVAYMDTFASPSSPLTEHTDDMSWLVTTSPDLPVELVRRGQLPERLEEMHNGTPGHPLVRWQDTLALNIVTQWHYTLTVAVVKVAKVEGTTEMVAVRKVTRRVYGAPTKAVFRTKDDRADDTIDFPNIHFNVDDFDDVFGNIQLSDGCSFAVLLTAGDAADSNAVIFRGLLTYKVIMERLLKKVADGRPVPTSDYKEFIPLVGARKEGKAEIAVCVSEADLMHNPSFDGAPKSTPKKESSSFFRMVDKVKEKITNSAPEVELQGNEMLQCCLTFISVNFNHVLLVLGSREPIKKQWLLVPSNSEELVKLLESEIDHEVVSGKMSPVSSKTSREGSVAEKDASSANGNGTAGQQDSGNGEKPATPTSEEPKKGLLDRIFSKKK